MSDSYTEFGPLAYDQQELAQRGFAIARPRGARPIVSFASEAVLNPFKSKEMGRPVYEKKVMFTHQHPGETLMITKHEVKEDEKLRFPQEWQAFLNGDQPMPDGIPLMLLFVNQPHIVEMLRGFKIYTVEQLSELSGDAISNVGMGCQEWINKANKYLEYANKGVDAHKFESEINKLQQTISTQARQISELVEQINKMMPHLQAPQGFDVQTAQINNQQREYGIPRNVNFSNTIQSPEFSGEVKQRGRPKGSRNKPKEA